jgi:EAL domain-containing protein (putative c-di-GMP-specific phosphodiesterase class I)
MAEKPEESVPLSLADELKRALTNDEFFLVYQPSIDLRTNAFAGVEALIRWRHRERGVVAPDEFIDNLEESGLIVEVGRWALRTACLQGATWHDKGYRFSVSVNVSHKQLSSSQFVNDVAIALKVSGFDPLLLVLEFSQDTVLDGQESNTPHIQDVKALGVRLAVDDYEPGSSSLDDLAKVGIDIIKLNREFIGELANSSQSPALIGELVKLAKQRHLQVTASGVEDAQQRRQLQIEQVSTGQGYLFSVPHEAEEIDLYLEDFAIFSGKPL